MKQELFKLAPFVTVILKKDNQILLVKRKNVKWFGGYFCCPGGKVDKGETIFQAAVRETQEELGITIDIASSQVIHVCHFKREETFEGLDFYVLASQWNGDPKIMEPEKHDSIEWFAMGNLPDAIMANHKEALEYINKEIFYSESGWK